LAGPLHPQAPAADAGAPACRRLLLARRLLASRRLLARHLFASCVVSHYPLETPNVTSPLPPTTSTLHPTPCTCTLHANLPAEATSLRHGLTEGAPGGRGQRAKEAARRREEQRQELIRMRDAARRAQAQQSAAAAAAAVAGAGAQTGRAEEAADRPEGEVLRPTGLQVFTKHQSQMQEALPRAALAPPSAADKVHSEAAAEREARGARDRPLQHRNGWERQLGSEGEERRAAVLAAGQRQRDRAVRSWRPPAPCSRTRAAGGRAGARPSLLPGRSHLDGLCALWCAS